MQIITIPNNTPDVSGVTHIDFAGRPMRFTNKDKWLVSTAEGILHQIENFTGEIGLVYFLDDKRTIHKQVIDKNLDYKIVTN